MLPASAPLPADIAGAVNSAAARSLPLRLDVRWFPTVTSTMDIVSEAAQGGASEGLVVIADEQTAGRGRRGRDWSSPLGAGLYVSFLFRPPPDASSGGLSVLTLAAGVAVRASISQTCGITPDLKWPNDVMIGRRKLAGILAEGVTIGTSLQTVVLGIGVNALRASHPSLTGMHATSLEEELGHPADRALLLEELLVTVSSSYDAVRRGDVDDILRAWRGAAPSAVGRMVEWEAEGGFVRGETAGVDDAGALLVRTKSGIKRILGGEVRWI